MLNTLSISIKSTMLCYFDAVALAHGVPHGHGDGRDDAPEDLQQGETERLAVVAGCDAGEAGAAPEGEAA